MAYRGPAQEAIRPRTMHARRRPRPTPAWWRDSAGVLCWASVLVVVALWVSGRGFQTVVTTYGGMLLAVAASIALTVVVLTSIKAARKALRSGQASTSCSGSSTVRAGRGATRTRCRRHRRPIGSVYVCGPDRWMEAMCAAVLAAGVPAGQLHQERFSW